MQSRVRLTRLDQISRSACREVQEHDVASRLSHHRLLPQRPDRSRSKIPIRLDLAEPVPHNQLSSISPCKPRRGKPSQTHSIRIHSRPLQIQRIPLQHGSNALALDHIRRLLAQHLGKGFEQAHVARRCIARVRWVGDVGVRVLVQRPVDGDLGQRVEVVALAGGERDDLLA